MWRWQTINILYRISVTFKAWSSNRRSLEIKEVVGVHDITITIDLIGKDSTVLYCRAIDVDIVRWVNRSMYVGTKTNR